MDDVAELLKTWELPELIPIFTEHGITLQALSALTHEDLKDLIPLTGPRVLFTRCWKTWRSEFIPIVDSRNLSTFSGLDISNLENYLEADINNSKNTFDVIVIPIEETERTENQYYTNKQILPIKSSRSSEENKPQLPTQIRMLENLLQKSLETASLLIYKGGALDGDVTRNLLASIIAKEILNENKNSPIMGSIYFKWTKLIKELFPGERTTTYYIPACTTASGAVLQARGKLVYQVLSKRRRLQQLGSLTTKKRSREESPRPSTSPRPLPQRIAINENDAFIKEKRKERRRKTS